MVQPGVFRRRSDARTDSLLSSLLSSVSTSFSRRSLYLVHCNCLIDIAHTFHSGGKSDHSWLSNHQSRHGALTVCLSRAPTMLSISVGGGESYPGRSFSISQLLYAAKQKLRGTPLGGRYVCTVATTGYGSLRTQTMQDRDHDEPGRGETKIVDRCFNVCIVTEERHISRWMPSSGTRWRC